MIKLTIVEGGTTKQLNIGLDVVTIGRAAATRAVQKIGQIRPYKIAGPATVQIEYTTRNSLSIDAGLAPGAEVLDDRTIRFRGKDFLEAWTRSRHR